MGDPGSGIRDPGLEIQDPGLRTRDQRLAISDYCNKNCLTNMTVA
jgi:hypothetical protein